MLTQPRSKSWAKTNRDKRSKLLNKVYRELYYSVSKLPNGKMTYREVAKVVKRLKEDNPWISRNVINFAKTYGSEEEIITERLRCFLRIIAFHSEY